MTAPPLTIRPAAKADLSEVLRLYAQPALDDGRVPTLPEAERIFERMARYPDYQVYVAVAGDTIIGTFALLVMDNLGHLGTRSGVIEGGRGGRSAGPRPRDRQGHDGLRRLLFPPISNARRPMRFTNRWASSGMAIVSG